MGDDGQPAYVSILEGCDDGTVWLQVQLPTGPLLRGPYHGPEDARRAATALERVARRRWAQDARGPGHAEGEIHAPVPLGWTTVDRGKEWPSQTPHRGVDSRFPRILGEFLRHST